MVSSMYEVQLEREAQQRDEGIQRFKREMFKALESDRFDETPYGKVLYNLSFNKVRDKIQEYLDSHQHGYNIQVQKYIELLSDDADVLAYVTLTSLIGSTGKEINKLTSAASMIIRRLKYIYASDVLKRDNPKLHTYLGYEFKRASKKRKRELIEHNIKSFMEPTKSNEALALKAGTVLIQCVELSGANILEVKMILTPTRSGPRHRQKVLRLTDEAKDILMSVNGLELAESFVQLKPLVCPPKDWISLGNGGYYTFNTLNLINNGGLQLKKLRKENLSKVLPIVNKIQQTPWRVNRFMYDLIKEVYEHNLQLGGAPPSVRKDWWDVIPKPEEHLSKEEWAKFNKKRQQIIIDLDSEFGRRLELVLALGVAEEMLQYDKFYYAYQLDYRGRLYPIDSHLNILKGNIVKSLLEFGEGQYLNADGKYWLSIHIANTYGLDKLSYNDRLQWVNDNYELINRVGTNPLDNVSDWAESDSPYEFVAACNAYVQDLLGEKVYLPIQLDATCSGIQMYSGLLRDKEGGRSVNVIGNTRNDIYQTVANRVEERLTRGEYDPILSYTTKDGIVHSSLTSEAANSLKGNITRSIVKRPTMTVPYNVTKMGMRDQLWGVMRELQEKGKAFWKGEDWLVNRLLTELTHDSIYDVVKGARLGRDYLVELGRLWSEPVKWYTPLYGFPVTNRSNTPIESRVKTVYGALVLHTEGYKHNGRRQSNQIAPNFIHSIDSTVLFGVIECSTYNMGSIHDCFLVPPNNGYDVQSHYKEAYVEVMEADPLRLIQQQLDPEEVVKFPEYGDLDLNEVYSSEYIIS